LSAASGITVTNGGLDLNGGSIMGTLVGSASTVDLGSGSSDTIVIHGNSILNGNIAAGQTIWVQGRNDKGKANLTVASGFTNAGTIRLESIDSNWDVSLIIPNDTLTNDSNGVLQVNQGTGGARNLIGNVTNQGMIAVDSGTLLQISCDSADGPVFNQNDGT